MFCVGNPQPGAREWGGIAGGIFLVLGVFSQRWAEGRAMAAVGFGLGMEEDAVYGAGGGGQSPVLIGGGVQLCPFPAPPPCCSWQPLCPGELEAGGAGVVDGWLPSGAERSNDNKNLLSPWTQGALSRVGGCAVCWCLCASLPAQAVKHGAALRSVE